MTYVVTERCVDCRYTYCVLECPVTCFYEVREPQMLVINPVDCIHCDACVPECPVNAIWADADLPPEYAEWEAKNEELWSQGTQVVEASDPLDSALILEEIQARESARGWTIEEPSGAG